MPYGTVNADLMTTSDGVSSSGLYGFKNRIINGAMVIDQRNAGASVTPNNVYTLDRWSVTNTQTGKFSVQQNAGSVTPPTGFTNYLGVTSLSAYSVLTGDTFLINQLIEGFNIADLGWGTANAKTVTLSFQVYSSLTGTFGGALINSGANRSYTFSYSIPTANTWTSISVTIAGDTSGTWLTTNGIGIYVRFGLGSGSTYTQTAGSWGTANVVQPPSTVSVVGTNGATFYITGVQLEKGSTATSFDYRPYGTELQLCQRYYFQLTNSGSTLQYVSGIAFDATNIYTMDLYFLPVPMRTAPTITTTGTLLLGDGLGNNPPVNSITWGSLSLPYFITASLVSSGLTTGRTYFIISGTALKVSAEL